MLTHVICLSDGKIAQGSKIETNIFRAAKVQVEKVLGAPQTVVVLGYRANPTQLASCERIRRVVHVWSRFGHAEPTTA